MTQSKSPVCISDNAAPAARMIQPLPWSGSPAALPAIRRASINARVIRPGLRGGEPDAEPSLELVRVVRAAFLARYHSFRVRRRGLKWRWTPGGIW